MPSTSSGSAAVADGAASVTAVAAEASLAGGDVWSAEAGDPSAAVVADDAARALSRYWMLRTFSPVEPCCSSGQVNAMGSPLSPFSLPSHYDEYRMQDALW